MIEIEQQTYVMLPLAFIRLDGETQIRKKMNAEHIDVLTEVLTDGHAFNDSIEVYFDGIDHWLADGFHRVEAAKRAGKDTLTAEVREGTREDAIEHACCANSQHLGLPRTNEDKRNAVMQLLALPKWQGRSQQEVANQCSVSQRLVSTIYRELFQKDSKNDVKPPVKPLDTVDEVRIRTPENDNGKQERVKDAIAQAPDVSNREIAKVCDVSEGLVRKTRKVLEDAKLPESDEVPPVRDDFPLPDLLRVSQDAPVFPDQTILEDIEGFDAEIEPSQDEEQDVGKAIFAGTRLAHFSSESNEWYTPGYVIDLAHLLMGGIDLDPASCVLANETVQAKNYYTIETNGLQQDWPGRVWLNPPFGRSESGDSNQDAWSHYLIDQYTKRITQEAVLFVGAVTDRRWFHRLWRYPICFTHQRIHCYTATSSDHSATHGTALVYFGPQRDKFIEIFSQIGTIVEKAHPRWQGGVSNVLG